MDVIIIKDKRLSSVTAADYQVCKICRIVDKDKKRIQYGYPCPICHKEGEGGHMYFHLNIHTIINLIQESYHSSANDDLAKIAYHAGKDAHFISVVIFFVTLREALLDNLIYELCTAQDIKKNIYERLISDNKLHNQKQNNLLPSLTGKKWKQIIETLNQKTGFNYIQLDNFIVTAVEARNKFIHEGSKYSINHKIAESCLKNIYPLLNLNVDMHNTFVHPIYKQKIGL